MSPLGPQDLVLHRLQHHVTQPAEMATCCPLRCLSASPLLDSVVIINSLAKTRITRTSSKNIMPVLDTGHLLAFPRDMPDTGEGRGRGVRWGGTEREGGEGASGWDYGGAVKGGREGEEMTWPHAPSVKRFSCVLALCPGQPVQVKPRAPTGRCSHQPLWSAGLLSQPL